MTPLVTTTEARVWGTSNSWSLERSGRSGEGQLCRVDLEITGDPKTGFHLVVAPEGFFAADTWHETQDQALAEAGAAFGVRPDDWRTEPR